MSNTSAEQLLQTIAEYLRADRIEAQSDGAVDFVWRGIAGLVHLKKSRVRLTFFIDVDPDPLRAEAFIAGWRDSVGGEVRHDRSGDGSILRVLLDRPLAEIEGELAGDSGRAPLMRAAGLAERVQAAWILVADDETDVEHSRMTSALVEAGVPVPPWGTSASEPGEVSTFGRWSWGSRFIHEIDLYMFETDLVVRSIVDDGPFFALSHSGHGLNSYGLSLVTHAGPVAAFVQHGFGGVYMGPVRTIVDIGVTYTKLRVLFDAVGERAPDTAAGVEGPRWLLLYSQFRGVAQIVDLDLVRAGRSIDDASEAFEPSLVFADEAPLFAALADKMGLARSAFGMGAVEVDWAYPHGS